MLSLAQRLPIDPTGAVNTVSGNNVSNEFVGSNIGGVLTGIMTAFLPLANLVAVVILIISGLLLIISDDENQLSMARKTVMAVTAAIILMNIAGPIALGLSGGFESAAGGSAGALVLSTQVLGFISFIEVPIVAIAVVVILINGIRAVATFGTDEGTTILRQTVMSVLIGMAILTAKIALTTAIGANPLDVFIVGNPDSHPLIAVAVSMLKIVLGFMALAAVVMIVIAGIMLVVNKGDQETADKARGIIVRTLIGLIVILISGGLVMIVLT